jgi:DNA-binding NarL/FixJ family response regulator
MSLLRVFLVEDSPVICDNLTAALEEMAPVRVVGAADNEAAAVAWLREAGNACDLVIVDIFLRRGSGLGVLRAVQRGGGASHIVVLSNYATADMRHRCLALGAHRVFDKSNEIDALIDYCGAIAAQMRTGGASNSPAA